MSAARFGIRAAPGEWTLDQIESLLGHACEALGVDMAEPMITRQTPGDKANIHVGPLTITMTRLECDQLDTDGLRELIHTRFMDLGWGGASA